MERNSKPDLTALLTALSITSGVVVSGLPALAEKSEAKTETKTETKTEKKSSAADEKKIEEKKKSVTKNRDVSGRGCNYPCGCHYGGKSMKGSGKMPAAESKTETKTETK